LGETQSGINTFVRGFYFRFGPTQYIDPQSFSPIAEKDGGAAYFVGGLKPLIGKGAAAVGGWIMIAVRSYCWWQTLHAAVIVRRPQ